MASASSVDPLIEEIPVGAELVKIGDRQRGPLGFNVQPGSSRFRPVIDERGNLVGTSYLASDTETALAEVLLRRVAAMEGGERGRRFYVREAFGRDLSRVRIKRAQPVARLHGPGLSRLGLLRAQIIDCPEADYPYTAGWAQSLWDSESKPHGISWTSRQNDSGRAYMLWEDRVGSGDLELVEPPLPLDSSPGLELVREACVAAGVDFDG